MVVAEALALVPDEVRVPPLAQVEFLLKIGRGPRRRPEMMLEASVPSYFRWEVDSMQVAGGTVDGDPVLVVAEERGHFMIRMRSY